MTHNDSMYSQDDSIENMLENLARAHRILEMEGHGDMSMGHLSVRDPHGRGLWLKRGNLSMGEVQTDDFILLDYQGTVLQGRGLRHLEWPLHAELMKARPEVQVVGHSHPPYATAFGATDAALNPLTNHGVWFAAEGVPRFSETSHIITTSELGVSVAKCLGQAEAVLLKNHGIAFVGADVVSATLAGVFLEWAAKAQLMIASSGLEAKPPDPAETVEKCGRIYPQRARDNYWMYFNRKLDRLDVA